ncbi:TAXI family TRAP transporter solute-binding subunit [Pseudooceanicola sediminis]|uniref:TAXI family TRAP transporter solute-binding subunit n=1 Tax=Pseudooceanicola sediminis TaxID=2211117 RepID=A0A399IXI3_9RHOB|nr:TAXI family TRAP transporter solute-binding subunit [Pseudooceanicola sediminis]RII37873.1 TAXI family TRAP transporter solute-binding subunit [Pseudooceanicola sediminis]|tara:strand:+ start:48728 stop:49687 length:960 start_codon:yes stop_codon:yes gene_type:complete
MFITPNFRTFAMATALTVFASGAALAQTVAIGTTKGGATAQLSNALAAVISDGSDLLVRPQAMGNTSQYLPLVDAGRMELGIANLPQASFAVLGEGMSEGQPMPNLKMVATLIPFDVGLLVASTLGISDIGGLAGKKVPKFADGSLGDYVLKAALATADLGYDDVTPVPTANFPAMFQAIKDGLTDVTIATVGSEATYDIEAAVGGVTFLTMKEGDGVALDKVLPGTGLTAWDGAKEMPGISSGTLTFSYPYMLFANADVSDEIISKVAKALYEGEAELKANGPLWATYDPTSLASAQKLEYHPGAVAYYKSVGIWPAD